jgi:sugar phosphate isomerase/epimerase
MSVVAGGIPLSLSYYTVPELGPVETVHAAADAGFDLVGLRLLHGQPGGGEAPLLQDHGLRRETMRALEARGVRALDASGARVVPGTNVDAFDRLLDAAAEMGARHILSTIDDAETARVVERMGRLCDKAAERRLTVDLEFVPWMAVPDLASADRLVTAVDRPNFGIAVDALHFHRSGSTPARLAAVARDRLRYLQICDAAAVRPDGRDGLLQEATKARLVPGDGAIDLVGILRAMPGGVPIAIEVPLQASPTPEPTSARLRRLVDATRKVLARAYP